MDIECKDMSWIEQWRVRVMTKIEWLTLSLWLWRVLNNEELVSHK